MRRLKLISIVYLKFNKTLLITYHVFLKR